MLLVGPVGGRAAGVDVSILTRRLGRMLLSGALGLGDRQCPVSILTRRLGRMLRVDRRPGHHASDCFNPHPAVRPDATPRQSRWSALPSRFNPHPAVRPDATRSPPAAHSSCYWCFNPHPAVRPDATPPAAGGSEDRTGFNPHPAVRPDATLRRQVFALPEGVSILTRRLGRMLRLSAPRARCTRCSRFNPHPAVRPDATGVTLPLASFVLFQSSPGG